MKIIPILLLWNDIDIYLIINNNKMYSILNKSFWQNIYMQQHQLKLSKKNEGQEAGGEGDGVNTTTTIKIIKLTR